MLISHYKMYALIRYYFIYYASLIIYSFIMHYIKLLAYSLNISSLLAIFNTFIAYEEMYIPLLRLALCCRCNKLCSRLSIYLLIIVQKDIDFVEVLIAWRV